MVVLSNTQEMNQITLTTGLLLIILAGIVLAMMNRETKVVKNQSTGCPCFTKNEKKTYQNANADFYAPYASQRNSIVKMKPISSESVILIDNY